MTGDHGAGSIPVNSAGVAKPTIALIGMRGAGKTTVGRALARILDGSFVDTDELVALHTGKTIAQIFAEEGEAGFRRHEAAVIEESVNLPPAVLSVGGGAVLNAENACNIHRIAWVVWLTAPAETLWQRISSDTSSDATRPVLTNRLGMEEIAHLLGDREQMYSQVSDVAVETSGRTPEEVARLVLSLMEKNRVAG